MFEDFAGQTPVGRVGTTEDVARAVVFLIENGFVTGQTVITDGGLRFTASASACRGSGSHHPRGRLDRRARPARDPNADAQGSPAFERSGGLRTAGVDPCGTSMADSARAKAVVREAGNHACGKG